MTIDEAIKHAEETADKLERQAECIRSWGKESDPKRGAINCEKCAAEHRQLAEWLKELKAYKENACDDAISRQDLLNLPRIRTRNAFGELIYESIYVHDIENLPPVTPTEKVGHWIDDNDGHGTSCSECGKWYPHSYLAKREIIYCCRCGVKMVEPPASPTEAERSDKE